MSARLLRMCFLVLFVFAEGLSRKSVNIGNLSFASQTAAENYVRGLLREIGYCDSVKLKGPEYYTRIMDIAKMHPKSALKLQDVQDFSVVRNKLSKDKVYELNIVRADSSLLDISWKKCIANNFKEGLNEILSAAFRYSVENQIEAFRSNSPKICTICNKNLSHTASHVDHVFRFDSLVKSFLLLNTLPVPTSFVDCPDGSNRKVLSFDSQQLSESFALYHETNAILRVTCPQCNLRRKRIFAPVEPVPTAHSPEPEPHDDWQYSLPDPLPEADNGAFEEYARPAAPAPQAFLAADLSGSESEDEEEEDIGVDLATKYPKRTYLDVPYTSKNSAKELGAK